MSRNDQTQKFALWIHLSHNMFNRISLGLLSLPMEPDMRRIAAIAYVSLQTHKNGECHLNQVHTTFVQVLTHALR